MKPSLLDCDIPTICQILSPRVSKFKINLMPITLLANNRKIFPFLFLAMGFCADSFGQVIYVSDLNGSKVGIYNGVTGSSLNTNFLSGVSLPSGIAITGSNLYVLNQGIYRPNQSNGSIGLYNASTGAAINTSLISGLNSPRGIAVSDSNLYVANRNGFTVQNYNATTGAVIYSTSVGYGPESIAVSGNKLYVTNDGSGITNYGTVALHNATTGVLTSSNFISGFTNTQGIALSGNNLYVGSATGNTIGLYNATTGATINANFISGLNQPFGITVSDSNLYVANNSNGTIGLYNATTGAVINSRFITGLSGPSGIAISPNLVNILSGITARFSDIDVAINPKFDGGTLRASSNTSDSHAFTVSGNNGVIDHAGYITNLNGTITNSAAGVNGKLIISNSGAAGQGSVTLSGNNSYSGGTEVGAGANLSISSASNIGTGSLALVGTATTTATLTTTADMTISNPIAVSGDPTFNVASGTTTTISSPIANGASAGDVVAAGGGTLNLTAVNTYTGSTTIGSGSTLALSGAGSIATSSSVANSGTLNISNKTGNVSVASFNQGSTGILVMGLAPTNNQRLNISGLASLAGSLNLVASGGTYSVGKYTLLTANGVSGTFGSFTSNLNNFTNLAYSLVYDANEVYLSLFANGPSSVDTQQSLVNTASALQSTYTLQNSVLANSFSYDCNEFGANGICISAGGRNTAVSAANGLNNTSALLIAAYRPHPNYRIGAYADQNLSVNNAGSTVNLGNNTPLIGLFGAWNQNMDGTGTEIKVSAAYGQKNTTVTRSVVGTSEPGTGSSQLNSQGAQLTTKYGFAVTPEVIVAPYVGMRYTQNNMNGYTEATSSTVTAPLTYAALNTNATTALAGLGASYRLVPKTTLFASAGVETDTNTANGTYSATGVAGLTPINFNANPVKTRPTAMLGASYDIEKNQRLGITGIYRQEPYQGVSTTTVMATYTIGL